jgi:D-alanyl-D-alanine carboxypeptidase
MSRWIAGAWLVVNAAGCTQDRGDAALQAVADSVLAVASAPGVIVAVRTASGVLHRAASGVADRESQRPMRVDDAFRLGSVSKTYTATVVLRLVEDGLLSLDDRLSRYLPTFPRGDEVSVRHLLDHTSGLRDFYLYLYYRPDRAEMIELVTRRWSEEELLELSARFGFSFDPGADWAYSNTNYYLLGVIIERVTGRPLGQAYRTYIYEPLEIEDTWLSDHEPARLPLQTTGYLGRVDAWEHSEMFGELGPTTVLDRSPVEWGAGGLASTAAGAIRFLSALMSGALLGAEQLAAMQTFRDTPDLGVGRSAGRGGPDGYGLGLIRMELAGATLLGHGGLFTGHTAGVWYLPACGVTIALYINRGFVGQRDALDVIVGNLTSLDPGLATCGLNRRAEATPAPPRSTRTP